MLILDAPFWLLLLPAPLLLAAVLQPARHAMLTLRVPFVRRVAEVAHGGTDQTLTSRSRRIARALFLLLCWALICLALARPTWLGDPIVRETSARDLMLLVDISQSMATADLDDGDGGEVSRFEAARSVIADFIEGREGDRIGLIVFGSLPFLQAPLTTDLNVVQSLLDEIEVGFAGPRTALGDALGLASQAMSASTAQEKTILVLTDGNDTASQVPPARAAEVVGAADATAYVIAFGDPESVGEQAIDLAVLQDIADQTGGLVLQATDQSALADAYAQIDRLEPVIVETATWRPRSDLYFVPLAVALILILGQQLLAALLALSRRRRRLA